MSPRYYFGCWEKLSDLKDAVKHVCTRAGDFRPDEDLCMLPLWDVEELLDFGCGVGRNISWLLDHTKIRISGYDHPNMINLASQYLGIDRWERVNWISTPLTNLRNYRFNFIMATLVFQHIPEMELKDILIVLSQCLDKNGLLYVHSRSNMDDRKKFVWPFILKYFDLVKYVSRSPIPRKWPDTPPFNDVYTFKPETHCRALLKVK